MTIGDAITAALQDLGVLAAGEVPSADDSTVALARVNDWIDALATEGLTMYGRTRTTWALTAGVSTYSVGDGATVMQRVDFRNTGADQQTGLLVS